MGGKPTVTRGLPPADADRKSIAIDEALAEPKHRPDADYISLSQAARVAPGRPSTNCLWRWCRRGVIARNGDRVRLQHVRVGGKIFTTSEWVAEFGRRLAQADAAYFDAAPSATPAPMPSRARVRCSRREALPHDTGALSEHRAALNRELDAEGL